MTRSYLRWALALLPLLLFCVLGCSFLKDLSADQCQHDDECSQFGAYRCSSDKVCVPSDVASGGNGGSAGSAGSKSDAGGGNAGMVSQPECQTNSECIDSHDGAPYICQSGACVSLTLPGQCPFVIAGTETEPTSYLTQPGKPIIIGAYVPISVAGPETHPYTLTYRFALEEFMDGTLGGPGSPHRPIVMVLCQSRTPDLKASVDHLVNTLRVPGILATLPAADLALTYDLISDTKRKVFLLAPFEADNALIIQDKGVGLMWHMLGPTTDLLPAYAPLIAKAEAYLLDQIGETRELKIAVVNTDLSWSKELSTAFPAAVTLNGRTLAKQIGGNYKAFQVAVDNKPSPDVSAVVKNLIDGEFDIIVSLGGQEFLTQIIPQVQKARHATLGYGPFYVLSPDNAFDPNLRTAKYFYDQLAPDMAVVDRFAAGINYASVLDDTIYQAYLGRIQARFQNVAGLESRENLYDAAYYMFYALAAAAVGGPTFDGAAVADGMSHLVQPTGLTANVGPDLKGGDMFSKVLVALAQGSDIALAGAMGPPSFNLTTGARKSEGSAWCIQRDPKTPSATPVVRFDAMRLAPPDMTMLELSPPETPFCFPIDPP